MCCMPAGDTALRSLVDCLARELRQACQDLAMPPSQGTHSQASASSGVDSTVCRAASLVTVLSEVIFGASAAGRPRGAQVLEPFPASHAGAAVAAHASQTVAGRHIQAEPGMCNPAEHHHGTAPCTSHASRHESWMAVSVKEQM